MGSDDGCSGVLSYPPAGCLSPMLLYFVLNKVDKMKYQCESGKTVQARYSENYNNKGL